MVVVMVVMKDDAKVGHWVASKVGARVALLDYDSAEQMADQKAALKALLVEMLVEK